VTALCPHVQRYRFVSAVASHGPQYKPQRRFLMVLTAMADHWSLVSPDPHLMASLFSIRVNTVRMWLEDFYLEGWLSPVPDSELALIHLPRGSAAYQALEPVFEWHTRAHAPHARARASTTPVKSHKSYEPIPLSRALKLAVESAAKIKDKQFAYLSFIQESLAVQPQGTEHLATEWNRYLGNY
jgi:hypothetical protein